MSDGEHPGPGGWNRIHFIVDDLEAEVARLRAAGVRFRNDVVRGPGGAQILAIDPAGNLVDDGSFVYRYDFRNILVALTK